MLRAGAAMGLRGHRTAAHVGVSPTLSFVGRFVSASDGRVPLGPKGVSTGSWEHAQPGSCISKYTSLMGHLHLGVGSWSGKVWFTPNHGFAHLWSFLVFYRLTLEHCKISIYS